jgi:hypothetical protein
MQLLAHLPHGAFMHACVCIAASFKPTLATTHDKLATLDHPDVATFLPHFGFQYEETYRSSYYPPSCPSHFWFRRDPTHAAMWEQLSTLAAFIQHERCANGTLLQRLDRDAIEQWWAEAKAAVRQVTQYSYRASNPDTLEQSSYVAVALAACTGPAWTIVDHGSAVERLLPAWPFRYAPADPLPLSFHTGMWTDLLCYAALPPEIAGTAATIHHLVYLSLVGPQKKLKAAWAVLMDGRANVIKLPDDNHGRSATLDHIDAKRTPGKGDYCSYWNDEPLPQSGMAHLVIHHRSENDPRPCEPFLHVAGLDGLPDLEHFAFQMDRACPYPIRSHWVDQLWEQGQAHQVIRRLPARGITAYWVDAASDTWASIVAHCANGGHHPDSIIVETFGATHTDAGVQLACPDDE